LIDRLGGDGRRDIDGERRRAGGRRAAGVGEDRAVLIAGLTGGRREGQRRRGGADDVVEARAGVELPLHGRRGAGAGGRGEAGRGSGADVGGVGAAVGGELPLHARSRRGGRRGNEAHRRSGADRLRGRIGGHGGRHVDRQQSGRLRGAERIGEDGPILI